MSWEILEVLSPGLQSSIQDQGRTGLTHLGISPGGAADPVALRFANEIVGNPAKLAGIEMALAGGTFRVLDDALVAATGAEARVTLDGIAMAMWTSFRVQKGQRISVGNLSSGARVYLAISGGIDVPEVLGSRSTFLGSSGGRGWGGHEGRALREGDVLSRGTEALSSASFRRAISSVRGLYKNVSEIRITRAPQTQWFSPDEFSKLLSNELEVGVESNRRGIRLQGVALEKRESRELVTEGVAAGAIQVASGGQPMILFCEQQTTGGYPKIANVIRADLFLLGQLRPGAKVRFREVSLEEAWRINSEREELWQMAVQAI